MDTIMSVFDNIKKYAKIKGMSLQQVALKSGLSINAIYKYKKIGNPSYSTIEKIADTLGISINDLIDDDKSQKHKVTPLDDEDAIFTYEGREIPKEDIELIKRLLKGMKD